MLGKTTRSGLAFCPVVSANSWSSKRTIRPGGQEIHLNHQGRHGDPPAPSAQPTDEAKQMQDPTLNPR
jgi:hypothetical protein